jgi:hypothetical protein
MLQSQSSCRFGAAAIPLVAISEGDCGVDNRGTVDDLMAEITLSKMIMRPASV